VGGWVCLGKEGRDEGGGGLEAGATACTSAGTVGGVADGTAVRAGSGCVGCECAAAPAGTTETPVRRCSRRRRIGTWCGGIAVWLGGGFEWSGVWWWLAALVSLTDISTCTSDGAPASLCRAPWPTTLCAAPAALCRAPALARRQRWQLDLLARPGNRAPVGAASIWIDTHVTVYDANEVMGREKMGEPLGR
jgi:hypothetical protein